MPTKGVKWMEDEEVGRSGWVNVTGAGGHRSRGTARGTSSAYLLIQIL